MSTTGDVPPSTSFLATDREITVKTLPAALLGLPAVSPAA